jgi:hypothetical protein
MSLTTTALLHAQITAGHNGTGAISVSGLQVGDLLLKASLADGNTSPLDGKFEDVISVADEIQQLVAEDLSSHPIHFVLVRIP